MKRALGIATVTLLALGGGGLASRGEEMEEEQVGPAVGTGPGEWGWPGSLDAVAAAPESHHVLLENASVRVLRVVIPPGEREPRHTHRWPSVMIVDAPARIRYFGEDGELVFESPEEIERGPRPPSWLEPEGPHSVENIDRTPYTAYRIELKSPRHR